MIDPSAHSRTRALLFALNNWQPPARARLLAGGPASAATMEVCRSISETAGDLTATALIGVIAAHWRTYHNSLHNSGLRAHPLACKLLILKIRRDVRVVEGARLEIALTVCDGVLQISITVAKPTT
jgi:hypothetical protein